MAETDPHPDSRRAPYVKPAVRTYPVFEQNSLGCTKFSGSFGCRRGPLKVS